MKIDSLHLEVMEQHLNSALEEIEAVRGYIRYARKRSIKEEELE